MKFFKLKIETEQNVESFLPLNCSPVMEAKGPGEKSRDHSPQQHNLACPGEPEDFPRSERTHNPPRKSWVSFFWVMIHALTIDED